MTRYQRVIRIMGDSKKVNKDFEDKIGIVEKVEERVSEWLNGEKVNEFSHPLR